MSRASCAGSLPDNIQFIQTNPTRTDSSSITNQTSQHQQQQQLNHFNQFTNPNINIQQNPNDIKQHQFNKHTKISKDFILNK